MVCVGGVIKICSGDTTALQTNKNQANNIINNNQQNNQTGQVNQNNNSNPSVILNLNGTQNNSQSVNNTQNSQTNTNSNTAQGSNGTGETYNQGGSSNTQTSNQTQSGELTYTSPFGFFFANNNGVKVSFPHWVRSNLLSLGAIKANNPVEYAMVKARADKNFVDAFIATVENKINRLHVYERVNKKANLYQYSVNASGKNLNISEWINARKNTLNYSLNIKTKKYSFREWINLNTETQKVNYGLNIETPKFKVNEWFNGTAVNYSYSLDIVRKPKFHNLQGITLGSARKEGNKVILTPNAYGQRGAFWSNEKVDLTKNFTVKAKLYLGNRPQGADGIAFVVQNSPQGKNALGMGGGGLGYRGIVNSFAVEFDTWRNPGEINGNHIGFDINGKGYREVPQSEVAIPLPQPLESGKEIPVTIKWNYLGGNRAKVEVEIFGNTYSYTLNNITKLFGGKEAYIGFTGATGGERNLQYVSNVKIKVGG